MNKGIVFETNRWYSIVQADDGRFLKVKPKKNIRKGSYIAFFEEDVISFKKYHSLISVAAVLLILLLNINQIMHDNIYAVVSLDINPSVAYNLGENHQVISQVALNEEGNLIINDENIGKNIEDVLKSAIQKSITLGYLEENESVLISETIINADYNEQLDHQIFIDLPTRVVLVETTTEELESARERGTSAGRQYFANEFVGQDIKEMTINELTNEVKENEHIKIFEQPAPESKDTMETVEPVIEIIEKDDVDDEPIDTETVIIEDEPVEEKLPSESHLIEQPIEEQVTENVVEEIVDENVDDFIEENVDKVIKETNEVIDQKVEESNDEIEKVITETNELIEEKVEDVNDETERITDDTNQEIDDINAELEETLNNLEQQVNDMNELDETLRKEAENAIKDAEKKIQESIQQAEEAINAYQREVEKEIENSIQESNERIDSYQREIDEEIQKIIDDVQNNYPPPYNQNETP